MAVGTLKDLISELHKAFEDDTVDIDHVENLMRSYKSNPQEWNRFAKYDRKRYTRNLVDEGNGKFNLMLLCWGENHSSAVHDHSDSHCIMKMLDGELREVRFAWPTDNAQQGNEVRQLEEIGSSVLHKNEVCYINGKQW